jgi:leucyl aminopeptidase
MTSNPSIEAWRAARAGVLVCALSATFAAVAAGAPEPTPRAVWITLGSDAFATASRMQPLPRLAEVDGVLLTLLPGDRIDELSERIHRELRRCGGFVAHESLAEAQEELARVAARRERPQGGLPFEIDQPEWVGQLAGAVSEAQILATITALSTNFPNRYHLHHPIHHSADWIRDQWAGFAGGRPEVTVQLYSHGAITPQPSVVLTIPGTTRADEYVILGGHQDSTRSGCSISSNPNCDAPGADDDASGIAVLSEVIRVALAAGFRPERTVQFMAYAAEEVGLDGSTDIAADYLAAGTDVVAVLQQDMTGYHGSTQDVGIITDHTDAGLNQFVRDLVDVYQPGLSWVNTACGYACSDHAPWDSRGFRASFAFEAQIGEDNPFIHSSDDTLATLGNSAAHAAKFARLAAAFLVETSVDALFRDDFETGDTTRWSDTIP